MFPKADSLIALRAARITDPVERLRYLRSRRQYRPRVSHVLLLGLVAVMLLPARHVIRPVVPAKHTSPVPMTVWLVETRNGVELYSNGLRVNAAGAVRHHARRYRLHAKGSEFWQHAPAGIVFHSTESDLKAFEPSNVQSLRRSTESLLEYVRRRQCYHFLIDRFGQVHRVVAESDSADHAGHSAWSWDGNLALNLNHAFLGVAFEARTGEPLSAAQVHSAKTLTEMLRTRHGIPAENCVAHAQVSLNPANRRIGWHTDWARDLPFVELGLPDNYRQTLAAVTELGFEYDTAYLQAAGEGLWVGIHRSEAQLKQIAADRGEPVPAYRRRLARRFEDLSRKGKT